MAKRRKDSVTTTETQPITVEKTEAELRDETRATALEAHKVIEQNYLIMAEAIFAVKHREWYRDYGFNTFVDYVQQELDMASAKAFALTKIWDAIKSLNLPSERLLEMGWSKAAIVAQHATEDNYNELIESAEKTTLPELQKRFSRRSGGGGGGTTTVASGLLLRFVPGSAQFDLVSQGIAATKDVLETEEPEERIAYICAEWMQYAGAIPEMIPLERIIHFLERTYGGKFIHQTEDEIAGVSDGEDVDMGEGLKAEEEPADLEKEGVDEEDLAELDKLLT